MEDLDKAQLQTLSQAFTRQPNTQADKHALSERVKHLEGSLADLVHLLDNGTPTWSCAYFARKALSTTTPGPHSSTQ